MNGNYFNLVCLSSNNSDEKFSLNIAPSQTSCQAEKRVLPLKFRLEIESGQEKCKLRRGRCVSVHYHRVTQCSMDRKLIIYSGCLLKLMRQTILRIWCVFYKTTTINFNSADSVSNKAKHRRIPAELLRPNTIFIYYLRHCSLLIISYFIHKHF